jgi:formiminotetrahydrofolate cyclodeaminase
MTTLRQMSLDALLDAFSSSAPTPGGGSAAAVSGAIGAALLSMVSGLPKANTTDPAELATLAEARLKLLELKAQLAGLCDRDTAAYDEVVAAYRNPKGTDEEKAARAAAIQDALRGATDVPLETMRACADALVAAKAVAAYGNRSAMSDVATAMQMLAAGLQAALFNVEINIGGLKDAAVAARINDAARAVGDTGTAALEALYQSAGIADLMQAAARRLA